MPRGDPEQQLKEKVARRYAEVDVDSKAWDMLRDLGMVDEALYHGGTVQLFSWYGRVRSTGQGRKPAGRAVPGRTPPGPSRLLDLTDEEHERAKAVARMVQREAGAIPAVRRFRELNLVEGPLSPEEAHGFVSSPATATLPRDTFIEVGIPLIHEAHLEGWEEQRSAEGWRARRDVTVDPPGYTITATQSVALPLHVPLPAFEWTGRDGRLSRIPFWPNSLLHDLLRLSDALIGVYPWEQREAAWFVLTDDVGLEPIRARTGRIGYPDRYTRGQIELSVDPWVSADTVQRTYRYLQRSMLAGAHNRSGDNRAIPERSLAVFNFVEELRLPGGPTPTFRDMARLWNQRWRSERPTWCYPEPLDKFKRTYDETKARLLTLRYALPGDEPQAVEGDPQPRWRPSWWVRWKNYG